MFCAKFNWHVFNYAITMTTPPLNIEPFIIHTGDSKSHQENVSNHNHDDICNREKFWTKTSNCQQRFTQEIRTHVSCIYFRKTIDFHNFVHTDIFYQLSVEHQGFRLCIHTLMHVRIACMYKLLSLSDGFHWALLVATSLAREQHLAANSDYCLGRVLMKTFLMQSTK